ncbi:MAG: ACP S-malonyltransferase [Patescibacteria group bacterium]
MSGPAFIFPGQGSQAVGMGRSLWEADAAARDTFAEADAALGFPLSALCFDGPEDELRRTENAQPAILTVSIAALRALTAGGPLTPSFVAGHSLGEYAALVAAGVLTFPAAISLVRRRGELMAGAHAGGAMAAVIGLDAERLDGVLADAAKAGGGVVEAANLNSPGQIVISGESRAVETACRLAKEAGAAKVVPLQVSGAFHSSLMRPVAGEFARVLEGVEMRPARIPVVANVTARPVMEPSGIRRLLAEQIYSPVRWEETVRYLLGQGVKVFAELGPGRVLTGLVRRISREARAVNIEDEPSRKEALAILGEV